MKALVLDTGALIALERNDRSMWAALRVAAGKGEDVVVPSTVLAQAWRGLAPQAMLARALAYCEIAPFDTLARAVGELCGKAGTSDICDAQVALVAASRADVLYTSDPEDLRKLLRACRRAAPAIVRC
ncbi:MAG TPA: hypothetical protein VJN18_31900 [Polyangiaceae bacterium]|nr:hypothetical protein [Polyangiaceae bacterium]